MDTMIGQKKFWMKKRSQISFDDFVEKRDSNKSQWLKYFSSSNLKEEKSMKKLSRIIWAK